MRVVNKSLSEMELGDNEKKELERILKLKRSVDGFKFSFRRGKCVAVGMRPKRQSQRNDIRDRIIHTIEKGGSKISDFCFIYRNV